MTRRFVIELIDNCAAMAITMAMVMTFIWPFMEDGFGSTKLKYFYLAGSLGIAWTISPVVVGIVIAVYKDWKVTKWK